MLQLSLVFGVTLVAFALVIGLMAVGVMLGRRSIQGSCGGLGSAQGKEATGGCSMCSSPDAACRELAARGQSGQPGSLPPEGVDDCGVDDCRDQCEVNGCTPEEIEACNNSRTAAAGAVAQSSRSC
jgi:hypothetical protein